MSDNQHLARPRAEHSSEIGVILMCNNFEFLEREKALHKTADSLGLTECQMCGFCCLRRPCCPTPDEVVRVASLLNITPQELASNYMVVDGEDKDDVHLLFAQETQLDIVGKYLPYNRTYDRGYCIMFDRQTHKCLIHDAELISARQCNCWEELDDGMYFNTLFTWSLDKVKLFLPNFDDTVIRN